MRRLARHATFVSLIAAVALAAGACAPSAATPAPPASPDAPPASASAPASPAATLPVDAEAAGIGRAYVEALATGDLATAEAMQDETMQAAAPVAALAQLWSQLVAQFGEYRGIDAITTAPADAYVNATVSARFANAVVPLIVTVDSAGDVAGFHLGQPEAVEGTPGPTGEPTPSASEAPYVDPGAYIETEVIVGTDPWPLPGTLTMPVGEGPFPGVVLVAGSGPQDRDETIGPNRPLRDLALGLASNGIAVLRYDKRTKVHAAAMAPLTDSLTVDEEVVADAVAAVELLRATPGVDAGRVVVAGHSLGGYLAPRIAAQADGSVAGIALLAGSISPLQQLIEDQLAYLASDEGGADPQAAAMLEALPAQIAMVESADLSPSTPASQLPLGIPAAYWLDLRDYDAGAVARGLPVPILLVQGGRDYQVPPSELAAWRAALDGRAGVTAREYPALNHLLMAGDGAPNPKEYTVPGHVGAAVVADLAAWVAALPSIAR